MPDILVLMGDSGDSGDSVSGRVRGEDHDVVSLLNATLTPLISMARWCFVSCFFVFNLVVLMEPCLVPDHLSSLMPARAMQRVGAPPREHALKDTVPPLSLRTSRGNAVWF